MDLDDLNIFDRYSTSTFALVLGMAIIGTITYIIYVIAPLYADDRPVFFISLLVMIFGIFIPVSFFLEMILDVIPDVVGKFVSGVLVAGIVWTLYHANTSEGVGGGGLTLFIVLPALFTILTSLIMVRGVIIPLNEQSEFEFDVDEDEGIILSEEPEEEGLLEDDSDIYPEEDSW